MISDNEKDRFKRLILTHLGSAHNYARWLTSGGTEAADLVQEVYLRAYQSFEKFRGGDGLAWVLTIVRNTFYNMQAQAKRRKYDDEFDEQRHVMSAASGEHSLFSRDPQEILECDRERRLLERLIGSLPCEYREVLVLREVEELSYREIAEIVGIPVGTVMSRLARARSQLEGKLDAHREDFVP